MKTTVILFSILLLSNTVLRNFTPLATYYLNKTYYATVLCENKENLELQCEGSCQLAMELYQINTIDKETAKLKVIEFENLIYITIGMNFQATKQVFLKKKSTHFFDSSNYNYLYQSRLYRPPIFLI